MTMTNGVAITGMGLLSPVGLSAPATCAALRAGVARLGEIETHSVDGARLDKVPVVGGRVPTEWFTGGPVEWEWPAHERFGVAAPPAPERLVASGAQRLIELALPAAAEAWRQAVPSGVAPGSVGLYLGTDYLDDGAPIAAALQRELGIPLQVIGGATAGRAAGLLTVEAAANDLMSGAIQLAIVGAVDSQIRTEVLERLESRTILRTGSNPHGVIPGEAAAFLVLERSDGIARRGARPLAWVMSCTSFKEPTVGTDEPNQSVALGSALRTARKEGGITVPPLVVCDLNGDRYRAMEWGLASVRALGDLHGDINIWHPADCIGDTGAASGVLNIVCGVTGFLKGYARAERILVWGASEGKSRAAVVLAPATS